MTDKRLRDRRNEYYYRLAKEEGYRSRSAYKLLEISEKYHLIKKGDVVVDLGAAPGGWMQITRKLVGEGGYVLGIDLKPIRALSFTNVSSFIDDVEKITSFDILQRLPREVDIVLSDLSPNISGNWELDHAKQIYLAEISLGLAVNVLRIGGNFLVKTFQGGSLMQFFNKVKRSFKKVKIIKPKASRKRSAEVYIVGIEFNDKLR